MNTQQPQLTDREGEPLAVGDVVAIVSEGSRDFGKLAQVLSWAADQSAAVPEMYVYVLVGVYRGQFVRTTLGFGQRVCSYYVFAHEIRKNRIQNPAAVMKQEFDL